MVPLPIIFEDFSRQKGVFAENQSGGPETCQSSCDVTKINKEHVLFEDLSPGPGLALEKNVNKNVGEETS